MKQSAEDWTRSTIVPGAGPLTGEALARMVSAHLGRDVKLRSAGMGLLRIVALFAK